MNEKVANRIGPILGQALVVLVSSDAVRVAFHFEPQAGMPGQRPRSWPAFHERRTRESTSPYRRGHDILTMRPLALSRVSKIRFNCSASWLRNSCFSRSACARAACFSLVARWAASSASNFVRSACACAAARSASARARRSASSRCSCSAFTRARSAASASALARSVAALAWASRSPRRHAPARGALLPGVSV